MSPLYDQWLEALFNRDQVILGLAFIAAIGTLWLLYIRLWWPRALRWFRVFILIVFFGSFFLTTKLSLEGDYARPDTSETHFSDTVRRDGGEVTSGLGLDRPAGGGTASGRDRR